MPKTSVADLKSELASVLIVMAKQVALWCDDPDLSTAFLGGDMPEPNPDDIDLDRFPMARRVIEAHDYAFTPTGDRSPDLTGLHELAEMLAGLPREDFDGSVPAFPNQGGTSHIADVCDAVWARAAIDGFDEGLTTSLSTRQVALLADMTEGAVRNAMTQGGEAGLKAIPKSKPVRFDIDEARRWLAGRRGFVPTPTGPTDDPILNERLRMYDRMEQLTDFIDRHARRLHGGIDGLVVELGWSHAATKTWCNGTFTFDQAMARQLGAALGADISTFSGKCLELSLRRDAREGDSK